MSGCPHMMRADLPADIPERMKHLPLDARGYPVPWFVAFLPDGTAEFRMMDHKKLVRAVKEHLCWVCGERLGIHMSFVLGPMCCVTRTTPEPPSHRDCAQWSARSCPFLTKPQMRRREDELTRTAEAEQHQPGIAIKRNPGVTAIWTTRDYKPFSDGAGGVLFQVGEPSEVTWWKEGRPAIRSEVCESIESGLPLLYQADSNDPEAVEEINSKYEGIKCLLP